MAWASRSLFAAALAAGLSAMAVTGDAQPSNAGYMLMQHFQTIAVVGKPRMVNLRGTIVNKCTAPLPQGALLQIGYDTLLPIALVTIKALSPGQTQSFNQTVSVAQTQPPNGVTHLLFVVTVPGATDQKTSPCTVEFFQP
jgi:hypothetical protein